MRNGSNGNAAHAAVWGFAALLVLASPASGQPQPGETAVPKPTEAAVAPKPNGGDRVADTAGNIMQKPLKDLNIIKPKVSPQLEAVMREPYALTGLKSCAQLRTAVAGLTEVLGPDVDSVQAVASKETAAEFGLSSAESVVGGLIPGMGIVRKISGAEKAQKHATAAVFAGSLRRAYLKATARAKGCKI